MDWRRCFGMVAFLGLTIGAWWIVVSVGVAIWNYIDPTL